MTLTRTIAIAFVTLAAVSLGGCAAPVFGPVDGPLEEQIMFDRAQGYEIHHISPDMRYQGLVGYPRTDRCCVGPPGPYFGQQ